MLALAQQVKALAQGLGFEACGITPAEPLTEAYERYLQAQKHRKKSRIKNTMN